MNKMTAEDALDLIGKASGWCDNPEPEDPDEALFEIQKILWTWVNNG